eukprot:TRINITY_DN40474_c0_g1_i4.p1 TRINITY_DN40474_c0_g1~~TRINITY_DN40474_c0_g1_i4.p1  ORF type:complete len:320 (+),score=65.38 TRINITY_DN40474_c0_g1_i4:129-1088(+)
MILYGFLAPESLQTLSFHSRAVSTCEDEETRRLTQVDFPSVPHKITEIFVFLTIREGSFEHIASAYARVCDQSCKQLARFEVPGGKKYTGLLIGRMVREHKRWGFQAVGKFFDVNKKDDFIAKFFAPKAKAASDLRDAHPAGEPTNGDNLPTVAEKAVKQAADVAAGANGQAAGKRTGPKRSGTSKINRLVDLALAAEMSDEEGGGSAEKSEPGPAFGRTSTLRKETSQAGKLSQMPKTLMSSKSVLNDTLRGLDLESPDSPMTRTATSNILKAGTLSLKLGPIKEAEEEDASADRPCRPCKTCTCSAKGGEDAGCIVS